MAALSLAPHRIFTGTTASPHAVGRRRTGTASGDQGFETRRVGEHWWMPARQLADHLAVFRDERDPAYGGRSHPVYDEVLDQFAPGHSLDALVRGGRTFSLSGVQYLEAIANSIRAVGQQEPVWLASPGCNPARVPDGLWWLAEGNHRLSAALHAGIDMIWVQRHR